MLPLFPFFPCSLFSLYSPSLTRRAWSKEAIYTLFFILGKGAEIIIDDWKNPQQFSGDYLIETIPNNPKFATLYLANGAAILVPSSSKERKSTGLDGVRIGGTYSNGSRLTISIYDADIKDFHTNAQKHNRIVAGGVFGNTIVKQDILDDFSTYFEAVDYETGYYSFVRSTFYEGVVYFLHYKCLIEEKDNHKEFARQTLNTLKYR